MNTTQQAENTELEIMRETLPIPGKRQYQTKGEKIGFVVYTKQAVGWPEKFEFTRFS